MKKIFALLAVVLAVVSCQKEINGLPVDSNNEAAVSFSVALPDDATRAAGKDSAKGGVTNVDMDKYDIRFILEVYDENGVLAKERMVNSGDATKTSFQLRLVPGRAYNFVVWADFVLEDSQADLYYNTNVDNGGLRNVQVIDDEWDAIIEARDAYTDVFTVHNFSSTSAIDMTLTRPFAKLRVVTNDIDEMISVRPAEVKVTYFNTKFYTTFDAFAEKASGLREDKVLTVTLLDAQKNGVDTYTDGMDAQKGVQTLFADYFFGAEDDRVMFTFDVKDNGGKDLPRVTFNTNIPVKRNNLTTVYGPILTDANNITVEIKPEFENGTEWNPEDDKYDVELISGTKTETVKLTTGKYLFDDVTIKAAGNAIEVEGDVVIDVMGVMNLESKGGIVVNNGSLVINGVVETRGAERVGILKVVTKEGSAIGGSNITIQNLAGLTAKANGIHAFGIGAEDATVVIKNTKIDYICGGHIQPEFVYDTDYGKSEPEGGAAIGGANVTIENSMIVKAEGGSKAAAIGNKFWAGTNIVIKDSTLGDIFGGNASAAIGGSRYNKENKQSINIAIEGSTIANAVGGTYGAGIGSGYDTYCATNDSNAVNKIEISTSTITAKGGKYAAGIGTGHHAAALTGSIDAASVINATSGEKFYKEKYTAAQNIGYGIVDPVREYKDQVVTFTVASNVISSPSLPVVGENGTIVEGLGKDIENENQYYASELEALTYIADQVNEGNDNFNKAEIVLSNDIDLSQLVITRAAVANNWTPIGTEENPFTGTFDGNGNTIKNLALVESEAIEGKVHTGFIGYAKDAIIKNVTFENVYINIPCLDIDHSQGHIGAVAGSLEGTSTIEDVTVKGDIKVYATQDANGASRVAVIAGGNSYGNVTMKNVHVIADEGSYLIANNNTGALAGQLQGKLVFENCSSNINVTVNKFFAGGLVGIAAGDSTFTNCHTTGDIAVVAGRAGRAHDQYRVGGIAGGWADGANKVCTLTNCSYTGKVSGKNSDGSVAEVLDYMGYVGRGYTLNGCQGSKVIIDGVSFIQKYNTAAEAGKYVNENGEDYISEGLYYAESKKTYVVISAEGLIALSSKTIKGSEKVTLGANIDLEGKEFNGLNAFNSENNNTFDGNNYTISNWTYNSGASDMGFIKNWVGTIKNVKFDNCHIKTGGRSAIVAAKVYGNIENVEVKNSSIEDSYWACGIIAGLYNAGSISNCAVTNSSVKSNGGTGGIVGVINESAGERKLTNCSVTGCTINNTGVYGEDYTGGGLVGMFNADGATYKFVNCSVLNNTLEGGYVYVKYPEQDGIIEE